MHDDDNDHDSSDHDYNNNDEATKRPHGFHDQ